MEVAGSEIIVIQSDGMLVCPTDVNDEFEIVIANQVTPVVCHLKLIFILVEGSRGYADGGKPFDIELGEAAIQVYVASVDARNTQIRSQGLVEAWLLLVEMVPEPAETEVGKPTGRNGVIAASGQTLVKAGIVSGKPIGSES